MKYITILLLTASVATADWTSPQVRKWIANQGITNDTSEVVVSQHAGVESGWNPAWGAKPTRAQVEAIDYATALAWCRTTDKAKSDDEQSPDKGWDNLSRKERFLLRVCYRLAKQTTPSLTLDQFKTQIRTEWDATE